MSTKDDFRRYAGECFEPAKDATEDIARKRFLELAKLWMTAASQLDDGIPDPLAPKDVSSDNHQ